MVRVSHAIFYGTRLVKKRRASKSRLISFGNNVVCLVETPLWAARSSEAGLTTHEEAASGGIALHFSVCFEYVDSTLIAAPITSAMAFLLFLPSQRI